MVKITVGVACASIDHPLLIHRTSSALPVNNIALELNNTNIKRENSFKPRFDIYKSVYNVHGYPSNAIRDLMFTIFLGGKLILLFAISDIPEMLWWWYF